MIPDEPGRARVPLIRLLRQHVKDYIKCRRYGYLPPALWETRNWLRLVEKTRDDERLPVTAPEPVEAPRCKVCRHAISDHGAGGCNFLSSGMLCTCDIETFAVPLSGPVESREQPSGPTLADAVATLGEVLTTQYESMRRLHDTVRVLVDERGPDSVSRQLYDDVTAEIRRHLAAQERRAERASNERDDPLATIRELRAEAERLRLSEDLPDGIELAYAQGFNNALHLLQEVLK